MQLLAQANDLSKKGQIYQTQGNYQYAANCFKKIIIILQGIILTIKNDKQKIDQLKNKVNKYKKKFEQMKNKEKQKNKQNQYGYQKISKLGFPTDQNKKNIVNNNLPLKKQQGPLIRNKLSQENFQKGKKNTLNISLDNNNKINNIKPNINNRNSINVNYQYNNFKQKQLINEIQPQIKNLIIKSNLTFNDIVGMEQMKKTLEQAIIRPRKRPDLYTGIRTPPKGLLLYGPPGNGKTYICKALANQSGCTFFALSASVIMNKLVGQSEKTLRKIFQAAAKLAPSIIFIDQIDSILTNRSQNQNQASRRLKTQFLVLLDGINSPKSGQIIVIGATNLPKQLDLAARRRFNKLIYIGMPNYETRRQLIMKNLQQINYKLNESQMDKIIDKLQGYSSSQITNIVKQVCMIPLKQMTTSQFQKINKKNIRKVNYDDFILTIKEIKPLLTKEDLKKYDIKQ